MLNLLYKKLRKRKGTETKKKRLQTIQTDTGWWDFKYQVIWTFLYFEPVMNILKFEVSKHHKRRLIGSQFLRAIILDKYELIIFRIHFDNPEKPLESDMEMSNWDMDSQGIQGICQISLASRKSQPELHLTSFSWYVIGNVITCVKTSYHTTTHF
jgi:hypothetical protein